MKLEYIEDKKLYPVLHDYIYYHFRQEITNMLNNNYVISKTSRFKYYIASRFKYYITSIFKYYITSRFKSF